MTEGVIIAIIAAVAATAPTIATVVTSIVQYRFAIRNAAKSDILQMIIEDHVAVQEGHLPTNYQNILNAYERYHKAGGDEFITDKKEDYKKWFIFVEKNNIKKGKK